MSPEIVYQWMQEIARRMPGLGKWQVKGLALFSLGIIWAEQCALTKVSEKLAGFGSADSLERRWQRWISNPRIDMTLCLQWWVRWIVAAFDHTRLVLLVDEVKLGAHLSVMMVGVAYEQRCIPLVWRCYQRHDGQVKLISELLQLIAEAVDFTHPPLVQADRGIGTSPKLCQAVAAFGWHYLFRVQNDTQVLTGPDQYVPLRRLVQGPGHQWSGHGVVFKKRGRLRTYVHVLWARGQAEPWCLVANDPLIWGEWYAVRVWQEEGFRDLKSGGWHWQRSRVWQPAHADRLILVLALAYAWTLTLGTLVVHNPDWRRRITRGTTRRFSLFRCGLRFFSLALVRYEPVWVGLFFAPPKRFW